MTDWNQFRGAPTLEKPETDPDVERYERMPIEQVRKELQEHNIDPAPTVAAVTRLIEAALAARSDPQKRR